MSEGKLEKRACGRFRIPGATVRTKRVRSLFRKERYGSDSCPLLDLSRGGVRFLTSERLKLDTPIILQIFVPGEDEPLVLRGHVRWFTTHNDPVLRYQFGVQLAPYGDKADYNPQAALDRVIALERSFAAEGEEPGLDS
jgi:hypothetical protein